MNADRLFDVQGAIRAHADIGAEEFDKLVRERCARCKGERGGRSAKSRKSHRLSAQLWNATFGTARSAGSSISKYFRCSNLNWPATRLLGKDWIMVFRLRTAPL